MVNNRRSELDIISEILTLSKNGAKKTEILYQGNMSYSQLQDYLFFLIEKDVLVEKTVNSGNGNGNSRIYMITEKGHNLLIDLNKTLAYLR